MYISFIVYCVSKSLTSCSSITLTLKHQTFTILQTLTSPSADEIYNQMMYIIINKPPSEVYVATVHYFVIGYLDHNVSHVHSPLY